MEPAADMMLMSTAFAPALTEYHARPSSMTVSEEGTEQAKAVFGTSVSPSATVTRTAEVCTAVLFLNRTVSGETVTRTASFPFLGTGMSVSVADTLFILPWIYDFMAIMWTFRPPFSMTSVPVTVRLVPVAVFTVLPLWSRRVNVNDHPVCTARLLRARTLGR